MTFSALWLHKSSPLAPSLTLNRTYFLYINTRLGGDWEDNIIAEGKTHICALHIGGPFSPPSFHCLSIFQCEVVKEEVLNRKQFILI